MPAIPQQQAINTLNNLIGTAQLMIQVYNSQSALDQYWTDNGIANIVAALGTVALNTDGTTGAADATPVETHPLNPATYNELIRTLTPNQLIQIKTILDAVVSLINGNAVSAQGGARAILNAAN
jgi:hypothetical protein